MRKPGGGMPPGGIGAPGRGNILALCRVHAQCVHRLSSPSPAAITALLYLVAAHLADTCRRCGYETTLTIEPGTPVGFSVPAPPPVPKKYFSFSEMSASDSSLPASELRRRYEKGGSIPDSDLSAAQLRARYGVSSNNREFSTRDNKSGSAFDHVQLIVSVLVVLVIVVGGIGYFLQGRE